ncbi:MAG: hypothetical protein ACI9MR_000145 [Myxococcota bacterium]|jgi:hypothetical protein
MEPTSPGAAPTLSNTKLVEMATLTGTATGDATSMPHDVSQAPPAIIGHYERIRLIGAGGMGTVYLARDTQLGRRVALKMIRPGGPTRTKRFFQEARATALLQHEHIVVIHEVGEHEGAPYMVLEYLEGQTLRDVMAGQAMRPAQAVEFALPIVAALEHAHGHGIVHRDLKPENIVITSSGVLKVLDFGIAKVLGPTEDAPPPAGPDLNSADQDTGKLTHDGAILGTLLYMAPEQWGQAATIDGRADHFALGLILYEMIAGQHPIGSLSREGWVAIVAGKNALPPLGQVVSGVPANLERVIMRCLQRDPAERYASDAALGEALRQTLGQHVTIDDDQGPYPGLVAFREADANRFFGRQQDVMRAVALLQDHPLVAVVGPSGVGKSSLVRAGVFPALNAADDWNHLRVRPGRRPLMALATMLMRDTTEEQPGDRHARLAALTERLGVEPGYFGARLRQYADERDSRVLLLVDQFEEAFTLSDPSQDSEQQAFIACLLGAADDPSSPVRVVLALRSDFLDRVAISRRLLDAVTQGLMLLRPPARQQLRAALVGPAALAGYRFEDERIVASMLDALQHNAAALPLLQFAAGQLWAARDRGGKRFTTAAYDAMGGIEGLLASHADAVLAELPSEARTLARPLFMRLVTVERTRAVVGKAELLALAKATASCQTLLDRLVSARLLVAQVREADGEITYELAHEALIATWPTLTRWLDEGREHAGFVEQLSAAARQWDTNERAPGLLWRGDAASGAAAFARRYQGRLAPRERAYLAAVLGLKQRARRVRAWSIAGVIGVLALMVVGGGVALLKISAAESEAVDQAGRTRDALTQVTEVNTQLTEQIAAVQAAQLAADKAAGVVREKDAELTSAGRDLQKTNARLEAALARATEAKVTAQEAEKSAQASATQARTAAERERATAERERAAQRQLTTALQRERARVKQLEKRAQKIQLELK